MNKKFIAAFIAVDVLVIGGVAYYLMDAQKKAIYSHIEQQVTQLNKDYNNKFTLYHNYHAFHSSGILIYQNRQAPYENFTLNYTINHPLQSILSGEYAVNGDVIPSDQMKKIISTQGPLITFTGKTMKNGDFNIDFSNPDLVLKDDAYNKDVISFQNINGKYTKKSNQIEVTFNVDGGEIFESKLTPNTKFSNITSSFAFDQKDKNLYKIKFNIADMHSQFFKATNLFADLELSDNNSHYTFVSNIGVYNIDTPFHQGIYAKIKYGFNGISKQTMLDFVALYEKNQEYFHSSSEEMETNVELENQVTEKFLSALKEGFKFEIKELTVGDKKDKMSLSFSFEAPTHSDASETNPYFFERNAQVTMKADMSGQYVPLIRMFSVGSLTDEEEASVFPTEQQLKIDFSYKNQQALLNSKPVESDFFSTVLRDIDKEFNLPNPNIVEELEENLPGELLPIPDSEFAPLIQSVEPTVTPSLVN